MHVKEGRQFPEPRFFPRNFLKHARLHQGERSLWAVGSQLLVLMLALRAKRTRNRLMLYWLCNPAPPSNFSRIINIIKHSVPKAQTSVLEAPRSPKRVVFACSRPQNRYCLYTCSPRVKCPIATPPKAFQTAGTSQQLHGP